jgi:hypothetical protein
MGSQFHHLQLVWISLCLSILGNLENFKMRIESNLAC